MLVRSRYLDVFTFDSIKIRIQLILALFMHAKRDRDVRHGYEAKLIFTITQGRRKNGNGLRTRRRRNTTSCSCFTWRLWLLIILSFTSSISIPQAISSLLNRTSSSRYAGMYYWGGCLHLLYVYYIHGRMKGGINYSFNTELS